MEKILCSGSEDEGGISRLKKRRLDESERGKKNASGNGPASAEGKEGWCKTKWEAEWLDTLSRDVDMERRTRELTVTERTVPMEHATYSTLQDEKRSESPQVPQQQQGHASYTSAPTFDPLHLPSLIALSFSLFGPLKAHLGESVREIWLVLNETQVRVALLGGFCLGVGVSLFAGR